MEGRLPETVLKGGAGSGVLRPRLVTADSGGPGHRPPGMMPGCEELAVRIRRQCRKWKRGPRPKIATVERREASVPRHGTRRASLARIRRVSQTRQQR